MTEKLKQKKMEANTVFIDLNEEINHVNEENSKLIQFIEYVEAMTNEKETRERIQKFMREQGYWPKN